MAYRNKTYVAFDGDNDITYYYLMKAWKANDNIDFDFHNAHDLNTARDSSQEESIKSQLRVRMQNSKMFVLLVGDKTKYLTKFVKWEVESAIRREIPIAVVYLKDYSRFNEKMCPSWLNNVLSIHIPFKKTILQYVIDNWPTVSKQKEDNGHYWYSDDFINSL